MSTTTAKRVVDTVILEIDADLAEKVIAVLQLVSDRTDIYQEVRNIADVLEYEGEVRRPSPLYSARLTDGRVIIDWERGMRD